MKTSTILIFLLFAFTAKTSIAIASTTSVLDVDGNEIQTGVKYYVLSALWGAGGGGLALGTLPDQKCPEIVIQHPSDLQHGMPVTFSIVDSTNDDVVNENVNLNIEFILLKDKRCTNSLIWQAVYDESSEKYWVITGGVKGESATLFTIKKQKVLGYVFNHCTSEDSCNDVGKYWHDDQIRLGLGEATWPWVFVKATKSKTIKQVVNVQ